MFGCKPSVRAHSPIASDNHPELDTSPLLNEDGITQCQSLIGALQWTVTLGTVRRGSGRDDYVILASGAHGWDT